MESQLDLWNPHYGERATARRGDPDTSHEAAMSFEAKRLTAIQVDVLDWFRQVGSGTDEELEDALLAQHPGFSTLRKRRSELVDMGKLRDSGKRRVNRNGRKMVVWGLV